MFIHVIEMMQYLTFVYTYFEQILSLFKLNNVNIHFMIIPADYNRYIYML